MDLNTYMEARKRVEERLAAEKQATAASPSPVDANSPLGGYEGSIGQMISHAAIPGLLAADLIQGADNPASRTFDAMQSGAMKALHETSSFMDSITPGPDLKDVPGVQQELDRQKAISKQRNEQSPAYGLTEGITQIATGLIGVGKVMAPLKAAKAGKAAALAWETTRGAAASALVLDPHEARMSDFVEQFPALQNPITEYLASDPNDSAAEGRLKNAIESVGIDLALAGVLSLSAKAIKLMKAGKQEEAAKVVVQLNKAMGEIPDSHKVSFWDQTKVGGQPQAPGLPEDGAPHTPSMEQLKGGATHTNTVGPAVEGQAQSPFWAGRKVGFAGDTTPLSKDPLWNKEIADNVHPADAAADTHVKPGPDAGTGADAAAKAGRGGKAGASGSDLGAPPKAEGQVGPGGPAQALDTVGTEAQAVPLGKGKKPDYAPKGPLAETTANAILDGAEADAKAIAKYGTREEAAKQGYKFSQTNIPWQKIGSSEDLKPLIDQTEAALSKRRPMTDARVSQVVSDMAEMFDEDPAQLMGEIVRGGEEAKKQVYRMEASYILAKRFFQDAYDLALQVKSGAADAAYGSREAAQVEVRKRLMVAADMLASGQEMRASSGRSLRRLRKEFAIKPQDIEQYSRLPVDQVTDVIFKTGGDLGKLKAAANPSFWRRVMDEGNFLLANNLLWMYPTHLVNTTTNLFMLVGRPLEAMIGGAVTGQSKVAKQAYHELMYYFHSAADAFSVASEAFLKGDSILAPHMSESLDIGHRVNIPNITWRGLGDIWDQGYNAILSAGYHGAVGAPTRALGAVDEFVQNLRYRAVIQARAAVQASEAGLHGKAAAEHIRKSLLGAFDEAGKAIDGEALREARIATFQQELVPGGVGSLLRNAKSNFPAIGLVLPYIKTPINVLRYSWKYTPGLNLFQTEFRHAIMGKLGGEEQARAIGQMTLASTFGLMALYMAASNKIVGKGPADPKLNAEWRATGAQPYSYIIEGEDGSKTYVPLGRFDPVGSIFGMVADVVDYYRVSPDQVSMDKPLGAIFIALAKNFSEKTFLVNINQAMRAMTDPDNNMAKFAGGLAGNLVPGSSALAGYVNQDPYLRDARTFIDYSIRRLPGASEMLPPRRDVFGDPVERKVGLTTTQKLDPVEAEHNRLMLETGEGLSPPSPSKGGGIDLRDVVLTNGRNAFDLYQEMAGKGLKKDLERVITSDIYKRLVDGDGETKGTRLYALRKVTTDHHERAWKKMLAEFPELRKLAIQKQLAVKDAVTGKAKQENDPNPAATLLRNLGVNL